MKKQSIALIIAWFGRWPIWINFFIETCRSNPDVSWYIFSDCGSTENRADNVKIIDITFEAYKQLVSEKLRINFNPSQPYKICDIKPAFGIIHNELLKNYDFIGFGDLDVFYGKIRDFYDYDTLNHYQVLSNHPERVSGHFFIMKNIPKLIEAFSSVPNWEMYMTNHEYCHFDENHFTKALVKNKNDMQYLFMERYSTPGPTKSMNWYWLNGILFNEFYCYHIEARLRSFLYLHFMDWRSNKWYTCHNYIRSGAKAPWDNLKDIIRIDWRRVISEGFMISPEGISPIIWPHYLG